MFDMLESELLQSWPSIVANIFAYIGYVYVGRIVSWGWLANMAANLMIVVTGIVAHQYGFLGNLGFILIGFRNFLVWRSRELAAKRESVVIAR